MFAANIALVGGSIGVLGEVIRRHHLDDCDETRHERVLRISRAATSVAIAALVAGLAWIAKGYASYLYLLFLAAERPGQLIWRAINRRERVTGGSTGDRTDR